MNLRAAPRSSAKVLRTIPQYNAVTLLSEGTEWCQVTYAGETGFVMTRYLSASAPAPVSTPTPTPTPAAAPIPSASTTARVTTPQGSLNLRIYARDNAAVLLTIPQNEIVIVHEAGSAWCRVTYSGVTGWVMRRFLTLEGESPAVTPAPAASSVPLDPTLRTLREPVVGRIMPTDKRLNLRAGCSTNTKVILEMPKYDFLTVLAVGDTWCQVEYQGKEGYCMTKYLEYRLYE